MKSLKLIMTIMLIGLFTMSMSSCAGEKKSTNAKTEQVEDGSKQGKEYTSAYICPMHCKDSGSDKPGKCSACGMDYKKNEKGSSNDHEGHDHDGHNHDGHNHDGHNHDGHNHDSENHEGHSH
jgi:hypothetical protein